MNSFRKLVCGLVVAAGLAVAVLMVGLRTKCTPVLTAVRRVNHVFWNPRVKRTRDSLLPAEASGVLCEKLSLTSASPIREKRGANIEGQQKKTVYNERGIEVEHGSFAPLVFTTNGAGQSGLRSRQVQHYPRSVV